jgi:putative hemolysin
VYVQARKLAAGVAGAWLWWHAVACSGAKPRTTPASQAERPMLANPAARKCIDDGYVLEPVFGPDGVPADHLCVDKASGRQCEEWDYFRGDCRLREPSLP